MNGTFGNLPKAEMKNQRSFGDDLDSSAPRKERVAGFIDWN
jgi:hypothetical protein